MHACLYVEPACIYMSVSECVCLCERVCEYVCCVFASVLCGINSDNEETLFIANAVLIRERLPDDWNT